MFRLYAGIVRDGVWYNHAQTKDIVGGALAVLDGPDRKGTSRLLNLIKGSCDKLFTEDGTEYELKDHDYFDLKVEDGWKIAMEAIKQFTGKEYPIFEEYFFCKVCSTPGNERYTKLEESWFKLIEDGWIEEHYLESPKEARWLTELPTGIELTGNRAIQGGLFKKIYREPITLGEMLKLQNIPQLMDSEASLTYAVWDAQIKGIDGLTDKDLTVYVKRNPKDSFCKKHLKNAEDIEAMEDQPKLGIDATYRPVTCKHCHSDIGGYLDFTNFFSFLSSKKSYRSIKTV
jgi:hypothetical protein